MFFFLIKKDQHYPDSDFATRRTQIYVSVLGFGSFGDGICFVNIDVDDDDVVGILFFVLCFVVSG